MRGPNGCLYLRPDDKSLSFEKLWVWPFYSEFSFRLTIVLVSSGKQGRRCAILMRDTNGSVNLRPDDMSLSFGKL